MRIKLALAVLALGTAVTVAACDDDSTTTPASPQQVQLEKARAATSKYQDINVAIADGYVDAKIVMQSMGHHYLKAALLDDKFDPATPELLVYAPDASGKMQLVAVEYAAPLDKLAAPPEGFDGTGDTWDRNTKYGLWTLHAWIWRDNAAGVFNPKNDKIVLDPGTLQGMRDMP